MTSIIFPATIEQVGNNITDCCKNLESITIPYVAQYNREPYANIGRWFGRTKYENSIEMLQSYYNNSA